MYIASVVSLIIRIALTALFAVFALVHIQHMLTADWSTVGLHWRLVDVFYSALAVVVVAGFLSNTRASVIALYSYSVSQLALIAFLAVVNKTWLPYTSLQGADVLAVVACLHVLALAGEGFVVKQCFEALERMRARQSV